ncbi:MAG: DUF4367 domain-containing protein [Bacillaceae bacterium]|nr:DUF4367 domain-containing protein [Bacillaceae bacterium]
MNHEDRYIKDWIQRELEQIPVDPEQKEQVWRNIQKARREQHRQPVFKNRLIQTVASVAIICVFISATQMSQVSAIEWLTQWYAQTKGKVTQIFTTIGGNGGTDATPNAKPIIEIKQEQVTLEEMSVDEAKKIAPFQVVTPQYLPENYTFKTTMAQLINNERVSNLKIVYQHPENGNTIEIFQQYVENQMGISTVIDNEDTTLKEIDINGTTAQLFLFKDGSNKLVWVQNKVRYVIESHLPEEELIRVAKSM